MGRLLGQWHQIASVNPRCLPTIEERSNIGSNTSRNAGGDLVSELSIGDVGVVNDFDVGVFRLEHLD